MYGAFLSMRTDLCKYGVLDKILVLFLFVEVLVGVIKAHGPKITQKCFVQILPETWFCANRGSVDVKIINWLNNRHP